MDRFMEILDERINVLEKFQDTDDYADRLKEAYHIRDVARICFRGLSE